MAWMKRYVRLAMMLGLALGLLAQPARAQLDHGTSAAAGVTMSVTTNPDPPLPRQPTLLTITLKDAASGAPLTDLQVEHQRLLHLIVVTDDLSLFGHVHPDVAGSGQFRLSYTFPAPGAYHLYADFDSASKGAQAIGQPLVVAGDQPAAAPLVAGTTAVDASGAEVQLSVDPATPRVGQPTQLRFHLTQNDQPITDLGPYLGVAGHLVAISQDLQEFLHTHPEMDMSMGGSGPSAVTGGMPATSPEQTPGKSPGQMAGMAGSGAMAAMGPGSGTSGTASDAQHQGMDHGTMPAAPPDARFGPDVTFTLTFRQPGLHKVWGQFSRDGDVITAPFVLNVAP